MGLKQPRLRGDAYYEIVDEFVQAVMGRWPNAVLQVGGLAGRRAGRGRAAPARPREPVGERSLHVGRARARGAAAGAAEAHLSFSFRLYPPQFEDFNIEHAAPLLERYRYSHVSGWARGWDGQPQG